MVLGFAWYRTLTWKMFVKVCLDTVETTATVLFIVAAACIFGWMLTATGVTAAIAAWVLAFTEQAWVFLLLANLLMLFVGCFLEPTAAITILVPILLPICQQLGIDLVHFGLVMVLNLMIGLLHPPMGMVLFVLARVARLSRRAHDDGDPAVAGAAAGVAWSSSPTSPSWCSGCRSCSIEAKPSARHDALHPTPSRRRRRDRARQLVGGTTVENVAVRGLIPPGHKVAMRAIAAGEPVRRYNQIIGFASKPIAPASTCTRTTSTWARQGRLRARLRLRRRREARARRSARPPSWASSAPMAASPRATTSASCPA